mmetsp:Transcript_32635/g.112921  ORF Transcript_32635/g.112921 Transcript_32635/m.112921 type:complete len:454 (+) Transcript_32635:522-1883(+)
MRRNVAALGVGAPQQLSLGVSPPRVFARAAAPHLACAPHRRGTAEPRLHGDCRVCELAFRARFEPRRRAVRVAPQPQLSQEAPGLVPSDERLRDDGAPPPRLLQGKVEPPPLTRPPQGCRVLGQPPPLSVVLCLPPPLFIVARSPLLVGHLLVAARVGGASPLAVDDLSSALSRLQSLEAQDCSVAPLQLFEAAARHKAAEERLQDRRRLLAPMPFGALPRYLRRSRAPPRRVPMPRVFLPENRKLGTRDGAAAEPGLQLQGREVPQPLHDGVAARPPLGVALPARVEARSVARPPRFFATDAPAPPPLQRLRSCRPYPSLRVLARLRLGSLPPRPVRAAPREPAAHGGLELDGTAAALPPVREHGASVLRQRRRQERRRLDVVVQQWLHLLFLLLDSLSRRRRRRRVGEDWPRGVVPDPGVDEVVVAEPLCGRHVLEPPPPRLAILRRIRRL